MLTSTLAVSFADTEWLPYQASERRPNLLVCCSADRMESVATQLVNVCPPPLVTRRIPGELALPDELPGSLMLWDVARLTLSQQIELYDWTSNPRRAGHVVSVTSAPLWPLVERGQFLEGLFYRLNIVNLSCYGR